MLIRDGDMGGRGRESEGSTADTARKRPERPWTATRTMEVLRRCPLTIAQRLVHCAVAVSTAALGQSQRQCPLHCCRGTTRSERSPTFIAQLHLPAHDLFWANLRVLHHLPPLNLAWTITLSRFIHLQFCRPISPVCRDVAKASNSIKLLSRKTCLFLYDCSI